MENIKILSGVFEVRPKTLLSLNAGGMIRLTPKKIYLAFKTDYFIKNQPGKPTIIIVKDMNRWFPVNETYARNNFDYTGEDGIDLAEWFPTFAKTNEHIRTKIRANFTNENK